MGPCVRRDDKWIGLGRRAARALASFAFACETPFAAFAVIVITEEVLRRTGS
jgi:hypothetical protein